MTPPIVQIDGYKSQTISFKSTPDGDIKLEVLYPEINPKLPTTVLIHYHGGFLPTIQIVGDRFAFLPYWLIRACARRNWIFVSPEYRLLPESTAQSSLEDATDAYNWVLSSLSKSIGVDFDTVILAGSSAGAYLAAAVAAQLTTQPSALLLIYGMLDATHTRYTTTGTDIFGQPPIDAEPVLADFPISGQGTPRAALSAYPVPANPPTDPRFALMRALHVAALFLDYMTGIPGLGARVAAEGAGAIPEQHRNLFPLAFGQLAHLPPTILLHGKNDAAVPFEQSRLAAEKLKAAGVQVHTEFPEDAQHGFDAQSGDVDVESEKDGEVAAYQSLRNVIKFLDAAVSKVS